MELTAGVEKGTNGSVSRRGASEYDCNSLNDA